MKKMILGLIANKDDADTALFNLKDAGIKSDEVSIIAKEDTVSDYRVSEGETTGDATVAGAVLGGIAGLLLSFTPIVVTGLGALFITGPLTTLLGTLTGAAAGGLIGAFIDMGIPENTARSYEMGIQAGGVLVTATVTDKTEEKAREILKKHNAENLFIIPYTEKMEQKLAGESMQQRAFRSN